MAWRQSGTCALSAKLLAEIDCRLAAGVSPTALAREHGLKADNLRWHRDRQLIYLLASGPDEELTDLSGLRVLLFKRVTRKPAGSGANLTKPDIEPSPGPK